jgi:diguanylate cyclase (GGDEF)-like protein
MGAAFALVLIVPRAHVGLPWFIGTLAIGDLSVLLGTVPQELRNNPGMLCAVMLLLAMVSYVPSISHFSLLSSLVVIGYAGSLYQADLLQSDAVLPFVSLLGLTLVLLSKNGLFQAEMERLTMSQTQTRKAAMRDPLTGLPNRAQFLEQVSRAIHCCQTDRRSQFAVLFIDLDSFKPINDRLGHKAGDAVLCHAAKLIHLCRRQGDVAGRYGGDEFTMLLHHVHSPSDAIRVAERLLVKLQSPIDVGEPVTVGASIGIALSTNVHERAEDLIRDADSAMYRAKTQGKNRYVLSDQVSDLPKSELKDRWERMMQVKW